MSTATYTSNSLTIDDFCNDLTESESKYCCEMCGKLVPLSQGYGTNRFCSCFCARQYSSKYAKTSEVRQKVSNTLKKFYQENFERQSLGERLQIYYDNKPITEEICQSLLQKWNINETAQILNISKEKLRKYIKLSNIQPSSAFVNPNAYGIIRVCRHVLNKKFEDGSITKADLEYVQNQCKELLYGNTMTTKEVCLKFLGLKKVCISFITHCLHISLPSISEGVKKSYKLNHPNNNKTDWQKYKEQTRFSFKKELLPYVKGYELTNTYKWFNPYYPKVNGLTKDHRVSCRYGYEHNIDPYLISHPANCEIMLRNDNSSKYSNCSLTVEQLIENVEWWNENIIHKLFNDFNS